MNSNSKFKIQKYENGFALLQNGDPVTSPSQAVLVARNPEVLKMLVSHGIPSEIYELLSSFSEITRFGLKPTLKIGEALGSDPFLSRLPDHPRQEWESRFPQFVDCFFVADLEVCEVTRWSKSHREWFSKLIHEFSALEKCILFHLCAKTSHIFLPALLLHNVLSVESLGMHLVNLRPGPVLAEDLAAKLIPVELAEWEIALRFLQLMM